MDEFLAKFGDVKLPINKEVYYTNEDLMHLLSISKRLAQHYRDSGVITYSQIGAKIYYKGENILKMIEGKLVKGKY